jgi:hypothetical protein
MLPVQSLWCKVCAEDAAEVDIAPAELSAVENDLGALELSSGKTDVSAVEPGVLEADYPGVKLVCPNYPLDSSTPFVSY